MRDLNDDINRTFHRKSLWEARIKELGGPDYARKKERIIDHEGKEVPGTKGYKYFGRARELPGVKELFDTKTPDDNKKNKYEDAHHLDMYYYGYLDEQDGILLAYESQKESQLRKTLDTALNDQLRKTLATPEHALNDHLDDFNAEYLPTPAEIEKWMVDRKKQELTDMYAT